MDIIEMKERLISWNNECIAFEMVGEEEEYRHNLERAQMEHEYAIWALWLERVGRGQEIEAYCGLLALLSASDILSQKG